MTTTLDAESPKVAAEPRRRMSVVIVLILAAVTLAAAVAIATGAIGGSGKNGASRNIIQGPQPAPVTVTSSVGAKIIKTTCPQGSQPYVFIQNASFSPTLKLGTKFVPGRYRIELSGTIANETTSAIVIDNVVPWALDVAWRGAKVIRPSRLRANSSGRLVIRGSYTSRSVTPASVGASLQWHWATPSLVPCGKRGLVDDD